MAALCLKHAAVSIRPVAAPAGPWRLYAAVAGLAGGLIGLAALAGWMGWGGWPASLGSTLPAMKANAALGYALLGFTMAGAAASHTRVWFLTAWACAAFVGLLAGGTAMQYFIDDDFSIDLRLADDAQDDTHPYPGRMAVVTAVNLMLLSFAVIALRLRPRWPSVLPALAAAMTAYLVSVGLLYGADWQYSAFEGLGTVSLPASTATLLLASAVLAMNTGVAAHGAGGPSPAVRRFLLAVLPMALLLPALIGWVRLMGQRAGWYDTEIGLVWMVMASTALFAGVAWASARWISRLEAALRASHATLESRVVERTARMEEALANARESEERIRRMAEVAPVAIILLDADRRVMLFNAAAEQMFGVSAAGMLGSPLDALMPARLRAAHEDALRECQRSGSPVRLLDGEARWAGLRASGEEFPIESSISCVVSAGQRMLAVVLRDLSEARALEAERQARAAAEEANRAKSQFLSHLSHELRTPLNAVIGFSQLMLHQQAAGDAVPASYAQHILRAGEHLLAMINDLLDLSRIEAGQLRLQVLQIDVVETTRQSVALVAAQAQAAGVAVRMTPRSEPALVAHADEGRLRQVLVNLLSNAIKYNRPSGTVAVEVLPLGEQQAAVRVADTGLGMSAEQLEDLFKPFNRLGREGGSVEGTGIGLSLSKKLVELMSGRLEVESELHRGSTFTVILQRKPQAGLATIR